MPQTFSCSNKEISPNNNDAPYPSPHPIHLHTGHSVLLGTFSNRTS